MPALQFDRIALDAGTENLREQVRQFVQENESHFERPNSDFVTGHIQISQGSWEKKVG